MSVYALACVSMWRRARPCAILRVHALQCAPMRLLVGPTIVNNKESTTIYIIFTRFKFIYINHIPSYLGTTCAYISTDSKMYTKHKLSKTIFQTYVAGIRVCLYRLSLWLAGNFARRWSVLNRNLIGWAILHGCMQASSEQNVPKCKLL